MLVVRDQQMADLSRRLAKDEQQPLVVPVDSIAKLKGRKDALVITDATLKAFDHQMEQRFIAKVIRHFREAGFKEAANNPEQFEVLVRKAVDGAKAFGFSTEKHCFMFVTLVTIVGLDFAQKDEHSAITDALNSSRSNETKYYLMKNEVNRLNKEVAS